MFIPNNFTLSANARIINGSPAALQEFPYAVFIYSEVSRSAEVCTGSLIADNVVVTAAHCLLYNLSYTFSPSQMLVSAGSVSNIRNNYDRYKVSKVIPHPQFSKASLRNDIGLIILSSPVPSSKATPATIYNESVKDNMNVIAAGWGVTSNDEDATSASVLNKVPLVTSSSATCKTLNPFWSSNSGSSICTLNVSGQDTCYGDSGGPLAYPVNGANYLVGLTSLGNAPGSENSDDPPICGAEGGAGYYTRVAYYLDWIVQVTG
ncbi:Trypsin-1, partial [Zancudomyces culisetae]